MDGVLELLRYLGRVDLILAIQRVFSARWDPLFESLSLLGGAQITVVAVAWARWFRRRALAARLLLALFLGIGVDLLIWNLFPTPRPDDPRLRLDDPIPISSFPSGHLVTVMTLWGTLASARVIPWLAVPAIGAAVGLSRLALAEHYPRDIIGGVVVGLILLGVANWLWPRLCAFVARQPWNRIFAAGALVAAVALLAAPLVPPARWQLLGLLAGVVVGIPLEARFVGYAPRPLPPRGLARRLAVALAGMGALFLVMFLAREIKPIANLLVPTLAALWITLGAPAALARVEGERQPAHAQPVALRP